MNNIALKKKTMFIVVVFTAMVFICLTNVAYASDNIDCQYLTGKNVGWNNYSSYSSPTYSNLVRTSNGYMRVQGNVEKKIVAVYYDNDFKLLSRRTIPTELPMFGGFYESSDNYYLVTGQANKNEDDSVEVFRVTKYDKSWNRISSCGLFGANTYYPFEAGSCSMTMDGRFLFVRTCHTMYASGDGIHHQANVTFQIDITNMTITYSHTAISNYLHGYVSHSFNQLIKTENNKIVAVDHGDASPRGILVMHYEKDFSDGVFLNEPFSRVKFTRLFDVPGAGSNYIGSSVGALEISSSSYLVAGNTVFKNSSDEEALKYDTRNVFVASVDKDTREVVMHWLTDNEEGSPTATTPHMVKVANNKYMVLWTESNKVMYSFVDGTGNKVGRTYSLEGRLSDCVPLVSNGKVIWYTWDNSDETFYSISVNNPDDTRTVKTSYDHDYQWKETKNGIAYFECSKCGDKKSGKVPTDFDATWRSSDDSYYYYVSKLNLDISEKGQFYIPVLDYSAESDITYDEIVVETDDEDGVIRRTSNKIGTITFSDAGTYTVTMYPRYNPALKKTYIMNVTKPLEGVELKTGALSPQLYGSSIALTAIPDGGKGSISYKFVVTDQSGKERVLQNGGDCFATWTPSAAGNYTIKAEAVDSDDDSITKTSEQVPFVIEKAVRPFVVPPASYNVPYSIDTLSNSIFDVANWEFATEDIGTELSVGEEQIFTAHYIGPDKDSFINIASVVAVTRSKCNHDAGTEIRNAKESTCTEQGATGDVYCTACGKMIEASKPIEKRQHKYDYSETTRATCVSTGIREYRCKYCNDSYEIATDIDPSNHVHVTVIPGKAATTTDEGLTEGRVCQDCGATVKEQTVIPIIKKSDQMGKDGTPLGEGASVATAEVAIASMTNDNDLPGSVFGMLQLKSKKQTKKSVTLSWKKIAGATSYVIYGNKCGRNNRMKRLASVSGKSKRFTKILGKKLEKGTYYKFMVVAFDKDNNVVSASKIVHVATKGGKVGNVGKVITRAKKNKVSIKVGKSFKLSGKQKPVDKKLKVRKHRPVTYESSNPQVATVSKKGAVKGKARGTCYVYAYAQNGVFAIIKVVVK